MKEKILGWGVFAGVLLVVGIAMFGSNKPRGTSAIPERSADVVKGDSPVAAEFGAFPDEGLRVVPKENVSTNAVSLGSPDTHEVLDERQSALENGNIETRRLVKRCGKYPLRIEIETQRPDEARNGFVAAGKVEMVADHVLVSLHEGMGTNVLNGLVEDFNATIVRRLNDERTFVVQLEAPGFDAIESAVEYFSQAVTKVAYAEPDYVRYPTKTPNDPQYGELWGMTKISAPAAWDISTGNPATIVAVIDTGMDMDHPDLLPNLWENSDEVAGDNVDNDGNGYVDDVNGWDFAGDDKDPEDGDGHGTHCAGTIAAAGNNANQVAGVCWTASIMPIRAGTSAGLADSDLVDSVRYAAKNNAKVLSNSYGGSGYSQTMYDAISYAYRQGAIFVVAAGNDSTDNDLIPQYPASYDLPNIISVAATDDADNLASFSNFGATSVDLAAPGVNIVSTYLDGQTESLDGTSMACPHVAGAMALLAGIDPGVSPEEAKQLLMQSVDVVQSLAGKIVSGGRMNVERMISEGGDSDGDGMPDSWETEYGFDPSDSSDGGTNDFDGDFLINVEEFQYGCNPTNSDSDADSLYDGWEVRYEFNPLDSQGPLPKLKYLGASTYATDAYDVAVEGDYVYVADGVNGLRIFDVSTPSTPQLISTVPTLGSARGVDVSGDYAYVADKDTGLNVVDVSDPGLPVLKGTLAMTAYNCEVKGNYCYVAAYEDDLKVVSVANPSAPTVVGGWSSLYRTVYDVAVYDNYVYLAMDGYIGRLSISDPDSPSGYTGKVVYEDEGKSRISSVHRNGTHIFLTQADYGYSAFDSGLNSVSKIQTEGAANSIFEYDGLAFVADGDSGLIVMDATNPANLTPYDSYENIFAWSVVFDGSHAYVAGSGTGLHVFQSSFDLDADGLYDKWERDNFGNTGYDGNDDPDNDGIINRGEFLAGLDPMDDDQDNDGLIDGFDEVRKYNTDPRTADTDGDGLTDHEEIFDYGTDPYKKDTDDDGMEDGVDEYPTTGDFDNDGLPDGWELEYADDLTVLDGSGNDDGDLLTNLEEYEFGSDPTKEDTDEDGYLDHEERDLGTNPANAGDPLVVDDDHPTDPVWWDPTISSTNEIGTLNWPFDSIQEAIDVASNNVKIIVMPGEYDGALNRDIDTGGKALTIEGIGGAANTWIFGDGLGSGFVFRNGETASTVIKGFTITTKSPYDPCYKDDCGSQYGILCEDVSSPLIADCVIFENELSGIECRFGSSPVITNCEINVASIGVNCSDGSAPVILDSYIYNVGYGVKSVSSYGLEIDDSMVSDCWWRGIWVQNDIALTITDSSISTNMGGMLLENSLATLDRCELRGNIAPDYYTFGDAVYRADHNIALEAAQTDDMEDTTDPDENGGAILLMDGAVLYAQNTLIVDNQAVAADPDFIENKSVPDYGLGGGIYVGDSCWVSCMNCTVADGYAMLGGGIASQGSHADILRNMIIWDNTAELKWNEEITVFYTNNVADSIVDGVTNFVIEVEEELVVNQETQLASDFTSLYCISGAGYDLEYGDIEGFAPRLRSGIISSDPMFVGGHDYDLLAGSPCIDVGTIVGAPEVDIEGHPRQLDGTGNGYLRTDLGAYEHASTTVDADGDSLSDFYEVNAGTDPNSADSDGDGLTDGYEVANGLGVLSADADGDADGDGLSNLEEQALGTSANNPDTDGDNSIDSDEVIAGTDPQDGTKYLQVEGIRQVLVVGSDENGDATEVMGSEIPFQSITGRTYTVECSTNMVDWEILVEGIEGSGSEIAVRDTENNAGCFYRLKVELISQETTLAGFGSFDEPGAHSEFASWTFPLTDVCEVADGGAGMGCDVTFNTVSGNFYTVEWCVDANGSWEILLADIEGTGTEVSVRDLNNGTDGLYRVEVKDAQ